MSRIVQNGMTVLLLAIILRPGFLNSASPPPGGKLAQKLLSAMKSGSKKDLQKLFHPGCPKNDKRFKVFERPVHKDLKKVVTTEVKPLNDPRVFKNSEWLVKPTHMLRIEGFESADGKSGWYSRADAIAEKNGRWYLVTCRIPKKRAG